MPDDPGNRDMESRLRDLQQLADEKLITSAEHEEHRRRLVAEAEDTQPLGTAVEPAPQEAMHGSAVALLDELIGLWSRWDLYAKQYLEEHAPRIVRSDDPDFRWIDQENERVVLTRLRALMSADEWRILPELIRARRSLALHELESDRDRPARLAAWTAAFESARREGRARLRREEEAVRARRSREAEAPAKRGPRGGLAGGRSGRDAAAADAEANPRRGPRPRPAGGRRRRSRRGGTRSVAESTATDPPASVEERLPRESVQVTGAEEAGARRPEAPTLESERAAESRMREDNLADETPLDPDGGESKPATGQPSRESRDAPVSHDLGGESVTRTTPQESGSPPSDPQRPSESLSDDADHTSGSTVVGSDPARSSSMPAGSDSNPVSSSPEVGAPSRPPGRDIVGGGPPGALTSELLGYARRLTRAGARSLADVVEAYARRVGAVEAGALPPSMSVAPSAVTPEMIGAALTRGRLEGLVEVFRNVLVFVPVLWTWLKLQSAVAAYEPSRNESFFDFWVRAGGSGPLGGTLGDAAIQVAAVLVVLIAVNVALGGLRRQNRQRAAHIGHDFTALLDRLEAAGAARRIADPQAALEGFVHASSELTANLRSVGELLHQSAGPLAESVGVAQQALREMSGAAERQERQLAEIVERLGHVAHIGDQLGALQREFADAQAATMLSAEALAGIRDSLDPSARDFAGAAVTLDRLAEQLTRMTQAMAGAIADLESGLDASSGHLREAALSMNAVATRVLDDLPSG